MDETHTTAWRGVDKEGLCFRKGRHAAEAALGPQRATQATGAEVTKRKNTLGLVASQKPLVRGLWGRLECSDLTDGPSLATPEAEEYNTATHRTGALVYQGLQPWPSELCVCVLWGRE